jgi:hypothetical protein
MIHDVTQVWHGDAHHAARHKSEPTIGEQSKPVLEGQVLEDVFGEYERDRG